MKEMRSSELVSDYNHQGDLLLQGDLELNYRSPSNLRVEGNLLVDGTLIIEEGAAVTVTGDLVVVSVGCEGDLHVQGNLFAAETVFGCYESGTTTVDGALFAELFLQGNHDFEIALNNARVHLHFSNFSKVLSGTKEETASILNDRARRRLAPLIGLEQEGEPGNEPYEVLLTEGVLKSPKTFADALDDWKKQRPSGATSLAGDELVALLGRSWEDVKVVELLRSIGFNGQTAPSAPVRLKEHKLEISVDDGQLDSVIFTGPSELTTLPLGLEWETVGTKLDDLEGVKKLKHSEQYNYTKYDCGQYTMTVFWENAVVSVLRFDAK